LYDGDHVKEGEMDGARSMSVGYRKRPTFLTGILQERNHFKDAGTNMGVETSNKIISKKWRRIVRSEMNLTPSWNQQWSLVNKVMKL
jgi:hypothetical protein